MTVTVRLFAVIRERAGVSSKSLEFPDGATVKDAVAAIADAFPAIVKDLEAAAFAINKEYVPKAAPLHDGDELAIIPPVSGG